jgi:hypothetical protein
LVSAPGTPPACPAHCVRFLRRRFAAHDLALRVELFARGFRGRHVDLRHDLRAHAAGADERRQHLQDAIRITFLEAMRELEHLVAHRGVAVGLRRGQQAAVWSTTVTCDAESSGMLDATRLAMAWTFLVIETTAGLDLQEHEAEPGRRSLTNADCRAIARCTRAPCTFCRLAMVRASSVSSACW